MNIIDVKLMADDEIKKFDVDLNAFLLVIGENHDREKLKTVIVTHQETGYAIGSVEK